MEDDGLQANERKLTSELAAEEVRKGQRRSFSRAVNVLGDEVELLKQEEALVNERTHPRKHMPRP